LDQQKTLISSLQAQPVLIVLHASQEDLEPSFPDRPLIKTIEKLDELGIKHIEIAWSPLPGWKTLIKEVKEKFKGISLGAASVTKPEGLDSVVEIGLNYSMTPFWDSALQSQAKDLNHLLVPGVFTPTEAKQAIDFGCQLIKLFPASILGINYLQQLKAPIGSLPFVIAAGGLIASDLKPWLASGYGALALGRKLIKDGHFDPDLKAWLMAEAIKG